jgi:endothelin-converting enzyme/putative endopeptidase
MNVSPLVLIMLIAAPPASSSIPETPLTTLPYEPSLDLQSMDTSVDPCVDFYAYVCGGWQKRNPLPADEPSWSVYDKLEDETQRLLWGVLEADAKETTGRTPTEQQLGDYFAACMDTQTVEARGAAPLVPRLRDIAALTKVSDLAALLGALQRTTGSDGFVFSFGSDQDWADSEHVIGEVAAGGLGLPDRDYYVKTDAKSVEIRKRYTTYIARVLALLGDPQPTQKEAVAIMQLETALAAASLTDLDKTEPHNLAHHATRSQLQAVTPSFSWPDFLSAAGVADLNLFNVTEPKFLVEFERQLHRTDLRTWKAYLRWHLAAASSPYLPSAFDDETFAFDSAYLRGVIVKPPRWKRCVQWVDRDLGEALGEAFVKSAFAPEVKQRTAGMTASVEKAMEADLTSLTWMSESTRRAALAKLHHIVTKVGYPSHWRDYSTLHVDPHDFVGNVERAATFEWNRQLAKIGKPLDRDEWQDTPQTVDAYFDCQMNDLNLPAGVLQPPLFDAALDDAPNYGNTGSTIGHELTHAFDGEGRQYDARGNLKNWWTPKDADAFTKRAECLVNQYGAYTIIDDITINSKLTLAEDLADLGGTMLAYAAWKEATKNLQLASRDGFTPDQRFFVGFGQGACANERPENERLLAVTDQHSPARYRINGVVANMPEFSRAFACKKGQPMVRENPCRVW